MAKASSWAGAKEDCGSLELLFGWPRRLEDHCFQCYTSARPIEDVLTMMESVLFIETHKYTFHKLN